MSIDNFISSWITDGIGHLQLRRPEQKNALSCDMWLAIPDRLQSLKDAGAQLILISGSNGIFAAGADLDELGQLNSFEDAEKNWSAISKALNFVAEFPLPTLASIDGPCLGGGCLLAIACDLRYATERSLLGIPIAKLGIVLDKMNLARLATIIGVARSKELIFRANVITASQAFEIGLVNGVFQQESFELELMKIISEIKTNSLTSIVESKFAFSLDSVTHARSLNEMHRAVVSSYLSPEFKERSARVLGKS